MYQYKQGLGGGLLYTVAEPGVGKSQLSDLLDGAPTRVIIRPQIYLLTLRTGERLPERKGGLITNGG